MIDLAATIAAMKAAGMADDAILVALSCVKVEAQAAPLTVQRTARQERNRRYYEKRSQLLPPNWQDIRQQVIERDGTTCAYCLLEAEPLHIDHIVPLSRGGNSDLDNLCVSCRDCNVRKKDRTPDEWRSKWV